MHSSEAGTMIEKIAEKDFDVDEFVQLAINDGNARNEIVHQMLTNSAIMVYCLDDTCWNYYLGFWDNLADRRISHMDIDSSCPYGSGGSLDVQNASGKCI
jgi:hypothetical protein